jgi:hypothetical protein
MMSVEWIVNTFVSFTTEVLGSIPSTQSPGSIVTAFSCVNCDVIATTTRSCIWALYWSGETTRAGRFFEELRSVKGNGTRTMSPRL